MSGDQFGGRGWFPLRIGSVFPGRPRQPRKKDPSAERFGVTAIYRLTRLHTSHRGGVNSAIDAEIRGVAKTNDASPFTNANEIVASRLGQTLGLPIPAGVVAEAGGKLYYLSLDVSKEGKALPPVIPHFVHEDPWLSAGCIAFDIWIANGDRNTTNLARDPAFSPPRVSIFDHGHSLLGTNPPTGLDRLGAARGKLGCTATHPPGSRQILLDLVNDEQDLRDWADRVDALPDFVVEDACRSSVGPGLNVDRTLADQLAEWLRERK